MTVACKTNITFLENLYCFMRAETKGDAGNEKRSMSCELMQVLDTRQTACSGVGLDGSPPPPMGPTKCLLC